MSNGACLALTDPRRLARVRLRADPETSPPISLLGPDPVTHPLSLETFAAALTKPTAPIKAVLLAQVSVALPASKRVMLTSEGRSPFCKETEKLRPSLYEVVFFSCSS